MHLKVYASRDAYTKHFIDHVATWLQECQHI
jgi:hypothetical protein